MPKPTELEDLESELSLLVKEALVAKAVTEGADFWLKKYVLQRRKIRYFNALIATLGQYANAYKILASEASWDVTAPKKQPVEEINANGIEYETEAYILLKHLEKPVWDIDKIIKKSVRRYWVNYIAPWCTFSDCVKYQFNKKFQYVIKAIGLKVMIDILRSSYAINEVQCWKEAAIESRWELMSRLGKIGLIPKDIEDVTLEQCLSPSHLMDFLDEIPVEKHAVRDELLKQIEALKKGSEKDA